MFAGTIALLQERCHTTGDHLGLARSRTGDELKISPIVFDSLLLRVCELHPVLIAPSRIAPAKQEHRKRPTTRRRRLHSRGLAATDYSKSNGMAIPASLPPSITSTGFPPDAGWRSNARSRLEVDAAWHATSSAIP